MARERARKGPRRGGKGEKGVRGVEIQKRAVWCPLLLHPTIPMVCTFVHFHFTTPSKHVKWGQRRGAATITLGSRVLECAWTDVRV